MCVFHFVFFNNLLNLNGLRIDELDRNLQDFKAIINQMNEVNEANAATRSDAVPYLGFTPLYPRIRYASVACSLL